MLLQQTELRYDKMTCQTWLLRFSKARQRQHLPDSTVSKRSLSPSRDLIEPCKALMLNLQTHKRRSTTRSFYWRSVVPVWNKLRSKHPCAEQQNAISVYWHFFDSCLEQPIASYSCTAKPTRSSPKLSIRCGPLVVVWFQMAKQRVLRWLKEQLQNILTADASQSALGGPGVNLFPVLANCVNTNAPQLPQAAAVG